MHPHYVAEKIQAYSEMVLLYLYKSIDFKRCDPAKSKQWPPPSEGWVKLSVDVALFAKSENENWFSDQDHNADLLVASRQG